MKSKIALLLIMFVTYSCTDKFSDEELTMSQTPYNGKEFRIDGYYLGETIEYNATYKYSYTFFYNNGITFSLKNFDKFEPSQINDFFEKERLNKDSWGVFQLTSNTVKVQKWRYQGELLIRQYLLENCKYTISNDSTLIYEDYLGYKSNCRFVKFNPKPDSTNLFIK